jgi:hypothetical protein
LKPSFRNKNKNLTNKNKNWQKTHTPDCWEYRISLEKSVNTKATIIKPWDVEKPDDLLQYTIQNVQFSMKR